MKLIVVLAVFVAYCAASAFPPGTLPGDNSHYVEGESQYIWMADAEGNPTLVDLKAPVQQDMTRNGANNRYWLYTRSNRNNAQVLTHNNANSVLSSNYRGTRQLKVIVHGWNNNGNSPMNVDIRSAFLDVVDCNVIVVDWQALANGSYGNAVNGVPSVGQHLANFITFLFNTAGGNWNNVHLVGFSLGAHVVGVAGRHAPSRPRRVTGLDPAGPTWSNNGNRLSTNAGQYVEAIHTDGHLLGIFNRVAHSDFYPNGGRNPQPGCMTSLCSHGRSTELFAATIRHNHLIGRSCSNVFEAELGTCNGNTNFFMGNSVLSKSGNGIWGLRTGSSFPF